MAMATPPKRSFKRTVASTVEERTPRFLLGSLALAMVISLVFGIGIGTVIGDNDSDTAKTPIAVKPKPTPTTRRPGTGSTLAPAPLSAFVVRTGPQLLVVTQGKRRTTMAMARATRVKVVRPAARSELKKGSRVLYVLGTALVSPPTTSGDTSTSRTPTSRNGAAQPAFTTKAILIVTGTAKNRIGSTITGVTSDTISFRGRKGSRVTISTIGATIQKTIGSTRAKLTKGRHVLVKSKAPVAAKPKKKKKAGAKAVARRRVVVEVIALPRGSLFG
jgi:hypothetical protein